MFFRSSIITNEHKVLYDSHTKRLLGPKFSQDYVVDHPEVLQAFQEGQAITKTTLKSSIRNFPILPKLSIFMEKPMFCAPLSLINM